jgi:hypothetical protein
MTRIPNTKTSVSYAYTISIDSKKVGTLQSFNPTSSKTLDRVRQLMDELDDIVEIVPGRTEHSIQIERLELYEDDSNLAFKVLDEQSIPFNIVETVKNGSGKSRDIIYSDCWIQSINKTVREGQINVGLSVTVLPTKITAASSSVS